MTRPPSTIPFACGLATTWAFSLIAMREVRIAAFWLAVAVISALLVIWAVLTLLDERRKSL